MFSVGLRDNGSLLVVKFCRSAKIYIDFQLCWGSAPLVSWLSSTVITKTRLLCVSLVKQERDLLYFWVTSGNPFYMLTVSDFHPVTIMAFLFLQWLFWECVCNSSKSLSTWLSSCFNDSGIDQVKNKEGVGLDIMKVAVSLCLSSCHELCC